MSERSRGSRREHDMGLPAVIGGTVLTVGTFDGVHRGHRLVLARLHAHARATGLASVLVTFSPHPLEIVNPAAAPLLLTAGEEKTEVLVESRIDYAVVLPFTASLAAYSAEQVRRRSDAPPPGHARGCSSATITASAADAKGDVEGSSSRSVRRVVSACKSCRRCLAGATAAPISRALRSGVVAGRRRSRRALPTAWDVLTRR